MTISQTAVPLADPGFSAGPNASGVAGVIDSRATADRSARNLPGYFVRLLLPFTILGGLAWGLPFPTAWTGIPEFLRRLEFWTTHDTLSPTSLTFGAPQNAVSPLFVGILALLIGSLWQLFDRRSISIPERETLYRVTRWIVAAQLIRQGLPLLIPVHAVPPDALSWFKPWGQFTTCDVLQTWLGFPQHHEMLLGAGDVGAGVALLIPWTRALGASLAAFNLLNGLFAHFGYCGTVASIFLFTFFCLACLLVYGERKRLGAFLLRRQSLPSADLRPIWPTDPKYHRIGWGVLGAYILYVLIAQALPAMRLWQDQQTHSTLRGVYAVERFVANDSVQPLARAFPNRWKQVAIGDYAGKLAIRTVNNSILEYDIAHAAGADSLWRKAQIAAMATDNGSLQLEESQTIRGFPADNGTLNYERTAPDKLSLTGILRGVRVTVDLRRLPDSTYAIIRDGEL